MRRIALLAASLLGVVAAAQSSLQISLKNSIGPGMGTQLLVKGRWVEDVLGGGGNRVFWTFTPGYDIAPGSTEVILTDPQNSPIWTSIFPGKFTAAIQTTNGLLVTCTTGSYSESPDRAPRCIAYLMDGSGVISSQKEIYPPLVKPIALGKNRIVHAAYKRRPDYSMDPIMSLVARGIDLTEPEDQPIQFKIPHRADYGSILRVIPGKDGTNTVVARLPRVSGELPGQSTWDHILEVDPVGTVTRDYLVSGVATATGDPQNPYLGSDTITDYKIDPDGSLVVLLTSSTEVGRFKQSPCLGRSDIWLVKIDGTGKTVWDRTYGGSLEDYAGEVLRTPDGGYAITGWTTSPDGTGNKTSRGVGGWLITTDPEGRKRDETVFGSTSLAAKMDGSTLVMTTAGADGSCELRRIQLISRVVISGGLPGATMGISTSTNLTDWSVPFPFSGTVMLEEPVEGPQKFWRVK